jgi:hypothetical protein
MYVDCSQPLGQCAAICVNDPQYACQDFIDALTMMSGPFFDCVAACQGMSSSASTGSGMMTSAVSSGSGMMGNCQQCGQQQCQNAFFQCVQSAGLMACQGWAQCAGMCNDAACVDACTAMYPGASGLETCACTSCANQCANVCN